MQKLATRLLTLLAIGSPALGQSVHIVDETGSPGSFAQVNDALAVAADGDLVLVKPGQYAGFTINDLAVTVVADGPGVLFASNGFFGLVTASVFDLPAGRAVNMAGFSVEQVGWQFGFQLLLVEDCDGPVIVRDCDVLSDTPGVSAARVKNSTAVSLVDSSFDTEFGFGFDGTDDGHALSTLDSNTFVYGCTLVSGQGQEGDHLSPPPFNDGYRGPAGWRVAGGFGLGIDSNIQGGMGGMGGLDSGAGCGNGGMGGPGLELLAGLAAPSVTLSNVASVGGLGGEPGVVNFGGPACAEGLPGPTELVSAGSITEETFVTRALETEYLVRVGQQKTEHFIGAPGDLIWHIFGFEAAAPTYVPELTGALVVGSPNFLRFRGVVPASGQKTLSVTVPPNGLEYVVLYEQAIFYDFTRFYISNPQFSVILDD